MVVGEDGVVKRDQGWRSKPPRSQEKGLLNDPIPGVVRVMGPPPIPSLTNSTNLVTSLGANFEDLSNLDFMKKGFDDVSSNISNEVERSNTGQPELEPGKKAASIVPGGMPFPDFLPMSEFATMKSKSSPASTSPAVSKSNDPKVVVADLCSKPPPPIPDLIPPVTRKTTTESPPPPRPTSSLLGDAPSPQIAPLSQPPPPLRLPRRLQSAGSTANVELRSNILDKLVTAAEHNVERKPEKPNLIQALKESWKQQVDKLEKLYEKVLSDTDMSNEKLLKELNDSYLFMGTDALSREMGLQLTENFLRQSGMKDDADFNEVFLTYISGSKSCKVTHDEASFILNRNGLNLFSLFKVFSVNQNVAQFKTLLQEQVSLTGHLFGDFLQIVTEFFNIKLAERTSHKKKPTISPPSKTLASSSAVKPVDRNVGNHSNVSMDIKRIQDLVAKKDLKTVPQIVNDVQNKVFEMNQSIEDIKQKLNAAKEEKEQVSGELKVVKEEYKNKMKHAQLENKLLRSRNSNLNDEAVESKSQYDLVQAKLDYVSKALDCLIVGEDFTQSMDTNNNVNLDEMTSLFQALKKLKDLYSPSNKRGGGDRSTGRTKVNLVTEEGNKLYIHSNRNNNIFVPDLEKLVGTPVVGLRVAQVVGEGDQEFPVRNGYIGRQKYFVLTR